MHGIEAVTIDLSYQASVFKTVSEIEIISKGKFDFNLKQIMQNCY